MAQLSLPRGAGGCIVLRDETSGDNRKTTIESRPNGVPSHRHMHGQITYNNGRAQFRSVHIQQREGQRRAPVTGCLQEGGPELHIPRISAQITHTTIHQPGMRCWGLVLYPGRPGTISQQRMPDTKDQCPDHTHHNTSTRDAVLGAGLISMASRDLDLSSGCPIPRISAQITHTTIHQPGMRCWGLALYPGRPGTLISAADARIRLQALKAHVSVRP